MRADDRAARRLHRQRSARCKVLDAWDEMVPKFVKVMPKDYKRVLAGIEQRARRRA